MFGLSVYIFSYAIAEKKLGEFGLFSCEHRVFLILHSGFSSPCQKELLIKKSMVHQNNMRCTYIFILQKINN